MFDSLMKRGLDKMSKIQEQKTMQEVLDEKIVVGDDLGFTQLKTYLGENHGFDADENLGKDGKILVPSLIKPDTEIGGLGDIVDTADGYSVDLMEHGDEDETRWFTGRSGDYNLNPLRFGRGSRNETYAQYFTTLALLQNVVGREFVDLLITGLPVDQFKSYEEEMKRHMEGQFSFGFEGTLRNIEVNQVEVFAQSVGAFYDYIYTKNGGLRKETRGVRQGLVVVIEIGGQTTDIVIMEDGVYKDGYTIDDIAVINVHEALGTLLKDAHNLTVEPKVLDHMTRNLQYGNFRKEHIEPLVQRAVATEFRKLKARLKSNKLTRDFRKFGSVLLSGGGGTLFESHVKNLLAQQGEIEKNIPVINMPDGEFSNARGFYKHGRFVLRNQIKQQSQLV